MASGVVSGVWTAGVVWRCAGVDDWLDKVNALIISCIWVSRKWQ
jgi:hypothetical protein